MTATGSGVLSWIMALPEAPAGRVASTAATSASDLVTPESKYDEVRAALGRFPEVNGLGVAEAYQRRDVGRALMTAALGEVAQVARDDAPPPWASDATPSHRRSGPAPRLYLAAGVAETIRAVSTEGGGLAFWFGTLVGGGSLVLVGQALRRRAQLSAWLICVGSAAGVLATFWTLLVPVLAVVVIVLVIQRAAEDDA
jgi:GNAT superfamily N-acetyltransferase